jgi:hypothetical protein
VIYIEPKAASQHCQRAAKDVPRPVDLDLSGKNIPKEYGKYSQKTIVSYRGNIIQNALWAGKSAAGKQVKNSL